MKLAWTPRLRKVALWIGAAVAVYAALGFLVAPPIVRSQMEQALAGQLGRKVTVEQVRINPFALSAAVRGFALKEPDGHTDAAGFEELRVDVTLLSLIDLGVVVEAADLTGPYLRAARLPDGRHSFQDIVDRLASAPPAPGPGPRFAVYNLSVTGGRIEFDDQPAKTKHVISEIELGLPFVSSLPSEVDLVVQPKLSAKVNGTPFEIAGQTKPFKDTQETTLRIDIDDLEPGKYLEYTPLAARVRVPSGRLTTRLLLTSIAGRNRQLQTLRLAGSVDLQGLVVRLADGTPLAALGRLHLELDSLDLVRRSVSVKSVRIDAPEADIVRQRDGSFNIQAALPAAPAKPAAPSRDAPFAVAIGEIGLSRGQVRFVDRTPEKPARASLNDISLRVEGLSNAPGAKADVKLAARVNRSAPLEASGKINPFAGKDLFLDLAGSARGIDMQPLTPYSIMYAGYAIAGGKLFLRHSGKLEDRVLQTRSNIRLEQFDFGEKVDSPTATNLPVTLAVALLKDRDGVIEVNLPLSVSLDDPQAGSGENLKRGAGEFLGKTTSEPFAVLGASFGGGEGLAYLEFAPGSAALDENTELKLKTLAKALYERPGLKLGISGRADPAADGAELRRAAAAKAVKPQADPGRPPTEAAVADEDLRRLAQARAQAARSWLIENGKLAAERISIAAPVLGADGIKDGGRPMRVDFSLK